MFAWFDKFPLIRRIVHGHKVHCRVGIGEQKNKDSRGDKGVKAENQIMLSLGMTLSEGYSVL